ncbi:MAG: hypothetical protein IJF18_06910 [Oscillospiraceae bacterium]|nr:hypothetical protein [Oscillospiraceae bacterium]
MKEFMENYVNGFLLLSAPGTLIVYTLIFAALFFVLLKKKNLLSRFPLFIVIAVLVPHVPMQVVFGSFESEMNINLYLAITFICIAFLALSALCLYIMINVYPVDYGSPFLKKYNAKQLKLIGARRLILTGAIETVIYSIPLIAISVVWIDFLNDAVIQDAQNILEALENVLNSLLAPVINIIVIAPTLLFAFMFIIPALSSVMFINGCVRTAIFTQESVIAKLLMAVLAFIPIVNVFYGFYCLKLISDGLKKEARPC